MSEPIRFGTDGVRGRAGVFPLDDAGAFRIGRGVGAWVGPGRTVLLARDTRASGPSLEAALVEGLRAAGAHARRLGVLPTGALSAAVPAAKAAAGVMVTASHNPWPDNGVKVLGADGRKPRDLSALEAHFAGSATPGGGTVSDDPAPAAAWEAALPAVDLRGLSVLLDAASGAAHPHARRLLEARGARVVQADPPPDGQNINEGTGAVHPPSAAAVRAAGCALGLALDGDADRIILIDAQHGVLDGDDLLYLLSRGGAGPVVGTVMSNGGLEAALGGRLVRAPVGDAHVAAMMEASGAAVGAEPSGHVLFADGLPTGDGLYAALRVLAAVAGADGQPVLPLPVGGWARWPAAQRSVRHAGPRFDPAALPAVQAAAAAGLRLVVRWSGTEPLLRVLVEGPAEAHPEDWAARIASDAAAYRA